MGLKERYSNKIVFISGKCGLKWIKPWLYESNLGQELVTWRSQTKLEFQLAYLMRFLTRDEHHLSLEYLDGGLRKQHKFYGLQPIQGSFPAQAELICGNEKLALLSLHFPLDSVFSETVAQLKGQTESLTGVPEEVSSLLEDVKAMLIVEVLWSDREAEETQDLLDPLWAIFFEYWDGLMYLEDEGWHDPFGLMFRVKERDYEFN